MQSSFNNYLDSQSNLDISDTDSIIRFLRTLTVQVSQSNDSLAVIAPTWLISEREKLDDFLPDFTNPEQRAIALRDFACIPVYSINPFFKNSAIIISKALKDRKSLILDDLTFDEAYLIQRKNDCNKGVRGLGSSTHPYPGLQYFFAGDLSVNTDSMGIALVCKSLTIEDGIELVFSKRIKVSKDLEADYESIEFLIKSLRDHGFNISQVGFDQYQSHRTKQILQKQNFDVHIVSYRESLSCNRTLKQMMIEGKFIYGDCDEVFIGEATELQVINSKRIDHLSSGGRYNSKDVWDAVVDASFLCLESPPEFHYEYA